MSTDVQPPTLAGALQVACLANRKWYVFFVSSLSVFFGGVIIAGMWNLVGGYFASRNCKKSNERLLCDEDGGNDNDGRIVKKNEKVGWFTDARNWAGEIISGQTRTGQILATLVLFLSMASLVIYLIDTYTADVETCDLWSSHILWQVDLGFNVFFFVYFIIQFLAAPDKFNFWIEIHSIVDYFTVIPSFISVYLNRNWIGLRFLRIFRITTTPDVLQFLNLLKSSTTTRLCHLIFTFLSVWFAGAGFVFLLENSGDPFFHYENSQHLTFWQCIYFAVVTMSTVGYGDVTCRTILGQIFNVIFLLGGLAMFASFVPEIADILGERSRYREPYKKEHGRRHVLLCGHITAETVSNFVADFLHVEREDVDIDVVIMNKKEPDIELQRLLKSHFTQLHYIQGNTMDEEDLEIGQVRDADACLILADKYCLEIDAEDAGNIMRVISIKNFAPDVKVIIQLLQYHSKAYLMNIPSWNWEKGDDTICLAELKLGFIAQSCLAPGFSTLMANLFTMRSYQNDDDTKSWQQQYKRGSGMEMYSIQLSPFFMGMPFPEAVELCFRELKILLIAVETTREDSNEKYIAINPGPSVIIENNSQGFFIAQSASDVKIASYYCKFCLPGVSKVSRFFKGLCSCLPYSTKDPVCVCEVNKVFNPSVPSKGLALIALSSLEVENTEDGSCLFDSTGMFHWCPDRSFLSSVISKKEAEELSDHIVMCLFADSCSALVGLQNFVMPLRASNFHYEELKPIVIIGDSDFLRKEWKHLSNYPKLFLVFGSPLNRALLRTININLCEVCVILTAKKSFAEDATLLDKEVILCSLNIQAMIFKDSHLRNGQMSIANLKGVQKSKTNQVTKGLQIPLITEIDNDINIKYIVPNIDEHYDEIYISRPFASGVVFTVSVLDSLMSTAYYSNNSLSLIRTLITGGCTPDLEQILAEGMTLECGEITPETIINRERCKVTQFDLSSEPFVAFVGKPYEEMFLFALENYGALCLGLYRVFNSGNNTVCRGYVITNPQNELTLISTDKCFCLCPGNKYPDTFSTMRTD